MALTTRWHDRNLSKLELVVALLLISIFIGAFSIRALKLFALSEQSNITMTVNNMTTAFKYKAVVAMAKNRMHELGELEKINPMTLMYTAPDNKLNDQNNLENIVEVAPGSTASNYAGELYDPDINEIEPGNWYFDRKDNLLIYLIKNTEFFKSQLDGPARLRFAVRVEYDDLNDNNKFDPAIDRFLNIKISSVDEYNWNL